MDTGGAVMKERTEKLVIYVTYQQTGSVQVHRRECDVTTVHFCINNATKENRKNQLENNEG